MKKLNDVLNGVMNDILSESSPVTGYNAAAPDGKFFFGSEPTADNASAETMGTSEGVPTVQYGADQAGLTNRLAQMWAGLSDNEKMAIIGGAGGTALAAGAGALYLRKKQRDANRAMGR